MSLVLCASQTADAGPYTFGATGARVYSWEEALFHACQYWKQTLEEPFKEPFIGWVTDQLRLPALSARLKELAREADPAARFLRFLALTDYFPPVEISRVQNELTAWAKRREWEKRKEQADFLLGKGQPWEAMLLYQNALELFAESAGSAEQNAALWNNMAVACMNLEMYADAADYLERALLLTGENPRLLLHLAEAAIYNRDFARAQTALSRADPADPDVPYLYGELNLGMNDIRTSIEGFEKAIRLCPRPHYLYRLADVYVRLRQYDNALAVLDKMPGEGGSEALAKQAEIHALAGNVPAAIKAIEKALFRDNKSVGLWTKLAMYHRLDYDSTRAQAAITRALVLDPENVPAQLENARIQKSLGKTKEHQAALGKILTGYKKRYRELTLS